MSSSIGLEEPDLPVYDWRGQADLQLKRVEHLDIVEKEEMDTNVCGGKHVA